MSTETPAVPVATPAAPVADATPPSAEAFLAEFEAAQAAAATDPPAEPAPAPADPDKTPADAPKPDGEPPPEPVAAKTEPTAEERRATKAMAAASKLHAKALETKAQADAVLAKAKQLDDLSKLPASQRLKAIGFADIKALADAMLAEGDEPAGPTPADEIAEIKRELAERKARETQEAQQRTIKAVQSDLFTRIRETAGDRFELIKAHGDEGLEQVWSTAAEFLALHGTTPDPMEIADAVEADYLAEAMAAANTTKFKARAGAAVPANNSRAPTPQQPLPGATTLTTRDGPEVPSNDELPMEPEARHARIMRDIERNGASA